MTSRFPADISTLTDHLVGELSPEENARVEQNLAATPEFRDIISKLQLAQDALRDPAHSHVNADAISQKLRSSVENTPRATANTPRRKFNTPSWIALGGAISAALVLMVGWWGYDRSTTSTQGPILASQTIYTTPAGERANIRLIDGTQVVLNVGSTLMIPADFGKSNRTLTLNGEALFTVVQHSKTPFIVSAGNTVSKVLGTTFGVRAYDDDTVVRVVVRDGRVMTNNTVVSPNDMVEVTRDGKPLVSQDVSIDNYTAFATGTLVFTDVMLSDALPSLNRWFNAEVIIADERLKSKLLTATYGKGSISDLSEYLSTTFNATVVREGQRLILYSR